MKAINIYNLTRIDIDENNIYSNYENVLSQREEKLQIRDYEFESLKVLVDVLINYNVGPAQMDGFFFSYKIKHIGKEFDLLKVSKDNRVLNVELKSESIAEEKIEKQLKRNMVSVQNPR